MKLVDWQTMQRSLTLSEMQRLVLVPKQPETSRKPIFAPFITWLRKGLWRLIGMQQVLNDLQHHNTKLVDMLTEIEKSRPLVRYQMPESAFSFREGTQDWAIFNATFLANEYRLPDALDSDDIVIDIGTHIGSFSYLALVRGAGRVFAFEPDLANFELATRNLRVFGNRARVQRKAVWRSDRKNDAVFAFDRIGPNTGTGCILWMEGGEKLEVIALDDIIDEATEGGRKRVKVLKVDCEGSEYPILLTSRKLHLVDHICGEYHNINLDTIARGGHQINEPKRFIPDRARVDGVDHYDSSVIAEYLEKVGFRVTLDPAADDPQLGFFFGQRS